MVNGVIESLQVRNQLSSCLADMRNYGILTSAPGRGDEEVTGASFSPQSELPWSCENSGGRGSMRIFRY